MKIFYFTATGNSLYVARRIGGELYSIPQMIKEGKTGFSADAIGFVFPCYAFGLPRMVEEFIQQSKFEAEYCFAVMTYGNIAAAGLKQAEEAGKRTGIRFDYTNQLLMVDNYLPLYKIEDQLAKEDSKKIEERLAIIVSEIADRRAKRTKNHFSSIIISRMVHRLFTNKHFDGGDKKFIVGNECNTCKICEQVCPKNNIKVADTPVFLHNCEGCYACIHHCPQTAIHVKAEKSGARFINKNTTLKDIINANNQNN